MESRYNKNERLIAKSLSKMPQLKKILKLYYSKFAFIFHKKPFQYKSVFNLFEISDNNNETFFGYYDKSPLSSDGKYLIYHSCNNTTKKLPDPKIAINIILKEFKTNQELARFKSYAYNWQQGSKLQWLEKNTFIFNDFDSKRNIYVSNIVNTDTCKIVKQIDFPIYDCYKNYGLSINYDRLNLLRPDYGYRNHNFISKTAIRDITNDGIFFINLNDNQCKLLLSLQKIVDIEKTKLMDRAYHKINHIMISPNGKSFIFLHRYFVNGTKFDRLFLSNITATKVRILSDHEMISHCFWKDNSNIVSYMRRFDSGDKFFNINIDTSEITVIGEGIIDQYGDGHPNCNGNKLIFDTYPNKARMKELLIYDIDSKCLKVIGEFYESFDFKGETRCDLHPRWSPDGKLIFFDSVHDNTRNLYYLNTINE